MTDQIRLLYITKDPIVGELAERAGVDWIFVDLEYRGKLARQANRDTVISAHTVNDVQIMRQVIRTSKLMVRINPWGDWSRGEIEAVLSAGADIIMLPYFSNANEVAAFISQVGGRAKTCLLLETLAAIDVLDEIIEVSGIDFVHIGLNDLHIERGTTFMFELLSDGEVDKIAKKLRDAGIAFGFGGIARIGSLIPPAERILAEHIRLGSTGVILSRSFCHPDFADGTHKFAETFKEEVAKIRHWESRLQLTDDDFFERNRLQVIEDISEVVKRMKGL